MATLTECYIDPVGGSDANGGTSTVDAWQTVTYALANKPVGVAVRLNLMDTGSDTPAATINWPSGGGDNTPIILQGMTSAPGDGGIGTIDFGGNAYTLYHNFQSRMNVVDIRLTNGAGNGIEAYSNAYLCRVTVDNFSAGTYSFRVDQNYCTVVNCAAYNCAHTYGFYATSSGSTINRCYAANGPTYSWSNAAIYLQSAIALRNIISVDGATNGIRTYAGSGLCAVIGHNSILSAGGTGFGILATMYTRNNVFNNLVEGFSGSGGYGIRFYRGLHEACYNKVYNCETDFQLEAANAWYSANIGNESLGASPFSKSGAISHANRLTYFAPVTSGGAWIGEAS